MQHTIVTAAQDPQHDLGVEELKSLARGRDHSVQIAKSTYYHDREKRQINHLKIIEKVLKLNNLNEEIEARLQEDIEKQIINDKVELVEADLKDKDNDDKPEDEQDDDGEPKKKKRKIGNMEVIFSANQTELVRRLFTKFIDDKVKFPNKLIKQDEIKQLYYKNMSGLSKNSPYTELDKFIIKTIVTKVPTLITQDKQRKANDAKKQKAYHDACMKKGPGKKSSKDNPKL